LTIATIEPQIEEGWKNALWDSFQSESFRNLRTFLQNEYESHKVFPLKKNILRAFNATPFESVKAVILGQDPYHNDNQANGLCFSVNPGIDFPPSLKNIYKELSEDMKIPYPQHGDLQNWTKEGVLLLNATLTVRAHQAGSHQKKGWEELTDDAIKAISKYREGIVFILWGAYARKKEVLIDTDKHFVLSSVHPSPLSAHRGFFGCKHFSKTNDILIENGKKPINWEIN